MPFGHCKATAYFMKIIEQVFGKIPFLKLYMDDIGVGTSNFDEHVKTLSSLFQKYREKHFFIKLKNSRIGPESINYIGNIVDKNN